MSSDTHANEDKLYVPPPGLAFRILGYASQNVVFSRTHRQPEVYHHSYSEDYSDQWFTLLHGTGTFKGLYAIKSRHTGKVLFSRSQPDPRVWHIDGDGRYRDNWFQIEPGKGQYAKYFRLITPSQGMALVSRTHRTPYLINHRASEIYADQHFSFIFEEMRIEGVDYDLDEGRIVTSTPIVLLDQTKQNRSSVEQGMSVSLNKTIMHSSTFEYTFGFNIKIGAEFSAKVPFVSEGKFSITTALNNAWHWGETTSYTSSYTTTFPVKAAPGETLRAVSTASQGLLDVPFTVRLSSKSMGVKTETKGIWHGVSTWDLRHSIEAI